MQNLFGSNLSALRKKAGVSQETLADQLGVSRQAVSNWERNLSEPDIGTINQISELLHVPVSDLMGSPSGGTQETAVKIRPALTVVSASLAAVHLVLGICGYVSIAAAIFLPVTCAFIQSIIYIAFTTMIKSNHYDMLAGFDPKKDSIPKTRLQMQWIAVLSGLTSILFELIFVLVYFVPVEQQMDITTVLIFFLFCRRNDLCYNGQCENQIPGITKAPPPRPGLIKKFSLSGRQPYDAKLRCLVAVEIRRQIITWLSR